MSASLMPSWLTPVLPVLIGSALTLAIQLVLVTLSARREREKWGRERAARTLPERQRVYLEFLRAWDKHKNGVALHHYEVAAGYGHDIEPELDWLDDLTQLGLEVELFGTKDFIALTQTSQRELLNYVEDEDHAPHVAQHRDKLVAQMRKDLDVPELT